ncbi:MULTISPECIES: DUF2759 family protein [Paenibacillus]|uniref:DUF2759 domain-containing protein n=1 Tax=Paenibacillus vini TaxID=1476024 RepID=A0ABQ4MIX1_9BACL|nr:MULTISPECIES: DUF2759 family protein [Paenibacillus]MBQ4899970.1 DUF2759 family protein [Paenibacillus sp. Marseille-P2973]MDN4066503.1 DUF2759 family protein [Paenibacillus vini]GIP55884.1 hypothetical protein J42TS3_49190 [Paenibacillus vini]
MLLAEAGAVTTTFNGFDIFMILFTIVILIGVLRLLKESKKNLFAIGFGILSLLIFLASDAIMIKSWFS